MQQCPLSNSSHKHGLDNGIWFFPYSIPFYTVIEPSYQTTSANKLCNILVSCNHSISDLIHLFKNKTVRCITRWLLEFLENLVARSVLWNVADKQSDIGNWCIHLEKSARLDFKVVQLLSVNNTNKYRIKHRFNVTNKSIKMWKTSILHLSAAIAF